MTELSILDERSLVKVTHRLWRIYSWLQTPGTKSNTIQKSCIRYFKPILRFHVNLYNAKHENVRFLEKNVYKHKHSWAIRRLYKKCTNEILFRHFFTKVIRNCHEIVLVFLVLLNGQLLITLGGKLNMRTENKHTHS